MEREEDDDDMTMPRIALYGDLAWVAVGLYTVLVLTFGVLIGMQL